jgi:hypothetical protein
MTETNAVLRPFVSPCVVVAFFARVNELRLGSRSSMKGGLVNAAASKNISPGIYLRLVGAVCAEFINYSHKKRGI